MRWFYRLQQRIAITRSEVNVLLILAFFFFVGLVARSLQRRPPPLDADDYAEVDRRFERASGASDSSMTQFPDEPQAGDEQAPPASPEAEPIDLNQATAAELRGLPGIGPTLAERILAYRDEYGSFQRVREIVRVRGIGEKTLARLKPRLIVGEGP